MTKIKLTSICISALHQRWGLGNFNIQTHDVSKNRDKFVAGLYLKSLAILALTEETLGKGAYKTRTGVSFNLKKKKNPSESPKSYSPAQEQTSFLFTEPMPQRP